MLIGRQPKQRGVHPPPVLCPCALPLGRPRKGVIGVVVNKAWVLNALRAAEPPAVDQAAPILAVKKATRRQKIVILAGDWELHV